MPLLFLTLITYVLYVSTQTQDVMFVPRRKRKVIAEFYVSCDAALSTAVCLLTDRSPGHVHVKDILRNAESGRWEHR